MAEWFRAAYGAALAEAVAIPLVEAWSGASAELLAPTVATEKLRDSRSPDFVSEGGQCGHPSRRSNRYSHEMPGESIRLACLSGGRGEHAGAAGPPMTSRIQFSWNRRSRPSCWMKEELPQFASATGSGCPGSGQAQRPSCASRLVIGTTALQHLGALPLPSMVFVNLSPAGPRPASRHGAFDTQGAFSVFPGTRHPIYALACPGWKDRPDGGSGL